MKEKGKNFIEVIIDQDLKNGFNPKSLRFRFPPEPNGYLHIGHLKAICLNFNLGIKYKAPVNLRFDDTNPTNEELLFIQEIKSDISWLGYTWDRECYASDYFEKLYEWAHLLIDKGLAYVDSQSSEEIAVQKGTPSKPGRESRDRNRTVEENKELFAQMREGKFASGQYVLRAKLNMDSPNMLLRDPVMYRILYENHPKTKNKWCIYPMYDWTHGQSDFIEGISHSLCSLEFMPHRALYNLFLNAILPQKKYLPIQREFSRLNVAYSITSKRKIKNLIDQNYVEGWDDPRLHTICALRRKGYTPSALKRFVELAGVSKRKKIVELALLEYCIREDLNKNAERVMSIVNPLRLTITNYDINCSEELDFEINPEKKESDYRSVVFSRNLFIERSDFKEEADKNFYRLTLGGYVRLKSAYIIKAEKVVKALDGTIQEVHCTYLKDSKSGSIHARHPDVKSTIHWLSIEQSVDAKAIIYDKLFLTDQPEKITEDEYPNEINPKSKIEKEIRIDPYLLNAKEGQQFQFLRIGYFTADKGYSPKNRVFNKTVSLRDSYRPV